MVFNATFYNISVISWQSVLFVEETGVPGENHRPAPTRVFHQEHLTFQNNSSGHYIVFYYIITYLAASIYNSGKVINTV